MTVEVRRQTKTPLWRNATVLKWSAQIFVLALAVVFFAALGSTALNNFERADISFGWGWLSDPTGVLVREGIDTRPDSGVRALATGIMNTFRVTFSGIIVATILGTMIGIGRLTNNWIVNKISTLYIEVIRNIPLLVQIFFWGALATTLSPLIADEVGTHWFKASNKGFAFSWIFPDGGFWPWLVLVVGGIVVGRRVKVWRTRRQEETGQPGHGSLYFIGIVLLSAFVGWYVWPVLGFMQPVFRAIETIVDNSPAIIIPVAIAVAAIGASALWIRRFFEARRTPAGFGKMTDDDWFRVIFAGLSGFIVAVLAFLLGGVTMETIGGEVMSIAELARTAIGNIFGWMAMSFSTVNFNQVIEGVRSGGPLVFERPVIELRGVGIPQFGTSGMVMTVPFFALWTALTLYTAAFIAEIVRGGILAVPRGQTEAASSVGLKRSQYLRLVILPQAFRIILPPMGNQYLNLMKNTSLGIAVAYADIVLVGTTIMNQTGQSLPVIAVWMAFFITFSLSISAVVNYYNRKMQLVER